MSDFPKYTPKQDAERHRLLNLRKDTGMGGVVRFEDIGVATIRELIAKGYLDPKEQQNDAPNIEEILSFMQANPMVLACGYLVANDREDRRISIEELRLLPRATQAESEAFQAFAERFPPDEQTPLRLWWD